MLSFMDKTIVSYNVNLTRCAYYTKVMVDCICIFIYNVR